MIFVIKGMCFSQKYAFNLPQKIHSFLHCTAACLVPIDVLVRFEEGAVQFAGGAGLPDHRCHQGQSFWSILISDLKQLW